MQEAHNSSLNSGINGSNVEDEIPKNMDEESLDYIESLIQVYQWDKLLVNNTNWYIQEVLDQIKSLYFMTTDGATKARYYLDLQKQIPKLEELKKTLYKVILGVMNEKPSKKLKLNFPDLETAISLAFDLRLFSVKQMERITVLHPKLCAKHMYKQTEEISAKFDKLKQEVKNLDIFGEDIEEVKVEEDTNTDVNQAETEVFIPPQEKEKEYCIICVQRVREIVFMPCCHFLTCLLCSKRIGKCPMCNTKVHKHLQIFWS